MGADQNIQIVLREGLKNFSLDTGIVSRIDENKYVVYSCESNGEGFASGTEFELQDSYCSDVVRTRKTCFYKDVSEISEMLKHPCYLNTQLRAYIGTPVYVDGVLWGTLNYSSLYPRKLDYTNEEIQFLESQAKVISCFLPGK